MGIPKTLTLKKIPSGEWYAHLVLEIEDTEAFYIWRRPKKQVKKPPVGVDVGLEKLMTLSNGEQFPHLRFFLKGQKALTREQRRLSKKKRGSCNRLKQRGRVARLHTKIGRQRSDYLHKLSHYLAVTYTGVYFEELCVQGLSKGRLAKHILDASWGLLFQLTSYKCVMHGSEVGFVDPRYTSQICSGCGEMVKKSLSVRVHDCRACGMVLDRDENAARNILNRGTGSPVSYVLPLGRREVRLVER